MKKQTVIIFMFLVVGVAVFDVSFLAGPSYAESDSVKNNFVPRNGAMSFIKFIDAPENHGVRDMRSLRKRYARYRSGSFSVTDDAASDCADCQKRNDK